MPPRVPKLGWWYFQFRWLIQLVNYTELCPILNYLIVRTSFTNINLMISLSIKNVFDFPHSLSVLLTYTPFLISFSLFYYFFYLIYIFNKWGKWNETDAKYKFAIFTPCMIAMMAVLEVIIVQLGNHDNPVNKNVASYFKTRIYLQLRWIYA